MNFLSFEEKLGSFSRSIFVTWARLSLFIIYFWFGILKILGFSPATQLVHNLFDVTINFMPFDTFFILFSCFEVLIGILFLFPRLTNIAVPLVFLHIFTTTMPLVLLPGEIWTSFMVPTLEGQYIIKNLLIIACALGVVGYQKKKPSTIL